MSVVDYKAKTYIETYSFGILLIFFVHMKNFCFIFFLIILNGCSKKTIDTNNSFWDSMNVIAEKVVVDGDTAVLCDYNKVKNQPIRTIPFDVIAENYEVVKLDNDNEKALLGNQYSPVVIADNYIGVHFFEFFPFKLFRRNDGKFLRDIGGYGQGPGEYNMVASAQIDERCGLIYILPSLLNKIFVYDIEGNYLRAIPLPSFVEGFWLDMKTNRIYAATGLGKYHESFLWVLDLDGNILKKLDSSNKYDMRGARIRIGTANSNDCDLSIGYKHVSFYNNTDVDENELYANQYDAKNPKNTVDYFCHYDFENNKLLPQFAIKNLDDVYTIYEFSNCFVVETLMSTYGVSEDKLKSAKIIVDKKTLKGCLFDGIRLPCGLVIDCYTAMRHFRDGYFLLNIFGSELKDRIASINRNSLTSSELENLRNLELLINDGKEDCNVVVIGKMKNYE